MFVWDRERQRERELSSKFVRQFGAKTFPQTSVRGVYVKVCTHPKALHMCVYIYTYICIICKYIYKDMHTYR